MAGNGPIGYERSLVRQTGSQMMPAACMKADLVRSLRGLYNTSAVNEPAEDQFSTYRREDYDHYQTVQLLRSLSAQREMSKLSAANQYQSAQMSKQAFPDCFSNNGSQPNVFQFGAGYNHPPAADDIRMRSFSLSSTGSSRSRSSTASSLFEGSPCASPPPPYHHMDEPHQKHSQTGLTLKSAYAQQANNSIRPRAKTICARSVKFALPEERRLPTGNLFKHRTEADFKVFNARQFAQRNAYNVRIDDDGTYGNNAIRKTILETLSLMRIASMPCVTCGTSLDVYDEFPLVNGTFFLSPKTYRILSNDAARSVRNVTIRVDSKFLAVVCLHCMDDRNERLRCQSCSEVWNGSAFLIGSLYSFDVFAAQCCCLVRRACDRCHGLVPVPTSGAFSSYSDYSRSAKCPRCGYDDYHFVKPLEAIYYE